MRKYNEVGLEPKSKSELEPKATGAPVQGAGYTLRIKKCSRCGLKKLRVEFGLNKESSDGYQSFCKVCKNESNAQSMRRDPVKYLRHHTGTRVGTSLGSAAPKGYQRDLEKLLGYTFTKLARHLREDLKKRGVQKTLKQCTMEGWHVDHIHPLKEYKMVSRGEVDWEVFRRCWKIENLSMIPAKANLQKGSKI